jgi:hypothetical protein
MATTFVFGTAKVGITNVQTTDVIVFIPRVMEIPL